MPPLVGREPFCRKTDLGRHSKLELIICDLQEREQLPDQDANVLLVDERIG